MDVRVDHPPAQALEALDIANRVDDTLGFPVRTSEANLSLEEQQPLRLADAVIAVFFREQGQSKEFQKDLKDFRTAKGTIQFAPEKPLPSRLLRKLVKARMEENERKKGK